MMKILLTIGLLIIGICTSLACTCEEPASVEESFEYSDAVFHGKVINKSFVAFAESISKEAADSIRKNLEEKKLDLFDSEYIVKVEFEIKKCYKGKISNDTIVLYTTRTSASCGYGKFEIGKEYIVYGSTESYAFWMFIKNSDDYALEKQNTFWTNQCTRTAEYDSKEAKELETLIE